MAAVKPRHAVGYHFWNHPDILPETLELVRKTYSGPLSVLGMSALPPKADIDPSAQNVRL